MADLENNPSDPKSKPESSLQEDMNEGKGGNNPQEGMAEDNHSDPDVTVKSKLSDPQEEDKVDNKPQEDIWMYHVTKLSHEKSFDLPSWSEVKPMSIANDKVYDGDLFGLPLASFTTTLYNGGFPTLSVYPRGKEFNGKHHYRVKIKFHKSHYHIFKIAEKSTQKSEVRQVHLLCIRKQGCDQFETIVHGILLQRFQTSELTEQNIGKYFPGGKANNSNQGIKMYVNVHFTHSIMIYDIIGDKSKVWDTVQRMEIDNNYPVANFENYSLDDLRSLWCIGQYCKVVADAVENLENMNMKRLQKVLKDLQSVLGSKLESLSDQDDNQDDENNGVAEVTAGVANLRSIH